MASRVRHSRRLQAQEDSLGIGIARRGSFTSADAPLAGNKAYCAHAKMCDTLVVWIAAKWRSFGMP